MLPFEFVFMEPPMSKFALRPYQNAVFAAIWNSLRQKTGLTFSVEIARQGGKNEISACLEFFTLINYCRQRQNLIKCSPTFRPQALISLARLKDKLNASPLAGLWSLENGHIVSLGDARLIFLSADLSANVVGNTAHLLLEVDEAQDVDEEKFNKEFRPMGSSANATYVLYGTTWDDRTLLEKTKQTNLELERRDGVQRHFRYDWQEVAKYNPDYLAFVEAERARLGENHPLFLTQYRLLPVHGLIGFFNPVQKTQIQCLHSRRKTPEEGKVYVAGIDLAGEAETGADDYLRGLQPRLDSTVITIAEISFGSSNVPAGAPASGASHPAGPLPLIASGDVGSGLGGDSLLNKAPLIKIVEHYSWTGVKHTDLYPRMVDLLKNVWHCRRVVVDATGLGQPVASFLRQSLGSRVVPFEFTASSKSELGFNLLAAVNSGRLKMYAADNSPEYREFWLEIDCARGHYRPNRILNFYVDPSQGHDDYLMSLALLVEASRQYSPRLATGR
jgi:hypothetical protein